MAGKPIQFRLSPENQHELEERSSLPTQIDEGKKDRSLSEIAKRDLFDRYYPLLQLTLSKISLSPGEAGLLCDVMNGTIHMSYSVSLLWAQVSDALQDGYAEKWDIDGKAFVQKLKTFTVFECMAIADAIERFWSGTSYDIPDMHARMREVGLIK